MKLGSTETPTVLRHLLLGRTVFIKESMVSLSDVEDNDHKMIGASCDDPRCDLTTFMCQTSGGRILKG